MVCFSRRLSSSIHPGNAHADLHQTIQDGHYFPLNASSNAREELMTLWEAGNITSYEHMPDHLLPFEDITLKVQNAPADHYGE